MSSTSKGGDGGNRGVDVLCLSFLFRGVGAVDTSPPRQRAEELRIVCAAAMSCGALALSAIIAATFSEPSPSRFVVAGYAPDYRLESLDLSALAHNLTDLLLFSIAPTPQGTIDPGGITQIHHMRAARAKKAAPHLRVLVSVGGGGRSAAFPQAVGSKTRREALAKALVKYCKRGKLDGADVDYEAPLGPAELRNLVSFLKLLRGAFDAATPPLQLTMAVHPQHAEALALAYAHVPRVHLMADGESPRLELATRRSHRP